MVISNNLPFVKHVINESKSGLIYDVSKKGSIISTINTAISDAALRSLCKKNASYYAENVYHWENYYHELKNIYVQLQHQVTITSDVMLSRDR
jgi:glycosyltransferase involved in cell wall biosynthesis